MATEAWALDGIQLIGTNFDMLELDVNQPKAKAEWITSADSEFATMPRQPFYENRVFKMKLRVKAQASMNAALDQVGVIQDKLRKASSLPDVGIPLVWTPANSTRTVTWDCLHGEMVEMPISTHDQGISWLFMSRPVFTVELTCKPAWRGTEVVVGPASSATPFVTLEVPNVPGELPALGRLIVTDAATQNRRHVEWGIENQYYNSGLSLLVDSDNMVTTGGVGFQAAVPAGAYDPNASGNAQINAVFMSMATVVCYTGNLSHVGNFRVKMRCQVPDVTSRVRLGYKVGDGPVVYNGWVGPPVAQQWIDLDMGSITIPSVASGTQRWVGQIEGVATSETSPTTAAFSLDYLILVPNGEGYGIARNPVLFDSITAFSARDEFNQGGAGVLTARILPVGGSWQGSGDADDFFIDITTKKAFRAATSDASVQLGRFAHAGTTSYTNVIVQADVVRGELGGLTSAGQFVYQGVFARWVNDTNYIAAVASTEKVASGAYTFRVFKVIAGVVSPMTGYIPVGSPPSAIRLQIDTQGKWYAWGYTAGTEPSEPLRFGYDAALATGGTLATGRAGLYDANTTAEGISRFYDNFIISTAATSAALYSGRTLEFRHNAVARQDSTGVYTGRPTSANGSGFLVPKGTSRVLVKARRNDVVFQPDDNVLDNTTISVAYTPRGLAVPR